MAAQQVTVSAKRWLKDTHSLFDFEAGAEDLEAWSFESQASSVLCRDGEQITASAGKPVLRLQPSGQSLEVSAARISKTSSPWLVLRDLPAGRNKLVEGDVIQIGRETLKVRQLSMEDAAVRPDLFGETCLPCEVSDAQCRICLSDGASEEDPFVQPCACSGSIANVHLGCLRQWAKTRMNLPEGRAERCSFRKPFCEMCKEHYPAQIQIGGAAEPLTMLPAAQGPFIVLESTGKGSKAKGAGQKGAFHVVSFAKEKSASMGRGKNCAVRVDDVSASRVHATLLFQDGEFLVQDQKSKYGTLLAMRSAQSLLPGEQLPVKIGRTVLSIQFGGELRNGTGSEFLERQSDAISEGSKSDLEA